MSHNQKQKKPAAKTEDAPVEPEPKNHRELGQHLELFMFHELSPGSAFFLPRGVHVYNKMKQFLRRQYVKRGYQEVNTPNLFNKRLWEQSGHWDHYRENMYSFADEEGHTYSLKPMNCPSHCLIFDSKKRSYRELPIRLADFGVLHRNELSGSLSGLLRVRKFCQDDAHIFCRPCQVRDEIRGCLDMVTGCYTMLGLEYTVTLSTRPTKFIGELETWERVEKMLLETVVESEIPYSINEKDGAFYGPKIDITIKDSLGRKTQCATIQLDFQLPEKFGLSYLLPDGSVETPVIIHRAVFGSFERMIAILLEHFQGKLPFWLSPRQVAIVPVVVNDRVMDYCHTVRKLLMDAGVEQVDIDDSTDQMKNKIRLAETMLYNEILVVGKRDIDNGMANVRRRGNMKLDELVGYMGEQLRVPDTV